MNQIANFAINLLQKNPNMANNPQAQQAQNAYLVEQMKRCNANACCGSTNC